MTTLATHMRIGLLLLAVLATSVSCDFFHASDWLASKQVKWYKGNLHTHSYWSDGDDFPEMIVDWYKKNGYDFLALSDHNILLEGEKWVTIRDNRLFTRYSNLRGADWVEHRINANGDRQVRLKTLEEFRPLFEEPDRFLLIPSEEISDGYSGSAIHVAATNIAELIMPRGGFTPIQILQRNVDAVNAQRERLGRPMFPHIAHPNWGKAISANELVALEGAKFFEVYNGHPIVNNYGDDGRPGTDELWDVVLTRRLEAGRGVMYGLAVDDAHRYHEWGVGKVNPGRGWVVVKARELSAAGIISALESGQFYSSTGITLRDVSLQNDEIKILIDGEAGVTYTTRFIGTRSGYSKNDNRVVLSDDGTVVASYSDAIGAVLSEVAGTSPSYKMQGDELYVRAKIFSDKPHPNPYKAGDLEVAWSQPFLPPLR
jgi:predicted metal-dependent phosphoesterase TrpH